MHSTYEWGEQHIPDVTRAAVVIEQADGTRMLYELAPPMKMDITQEIEFDPHQIAGPITDSFYKLAFHGLFKGGRIWKGRMPGDDPQEIEPGRQEIEGA